MSETIKVELPRGLVEMFRRKAMERYGYRKGAVKRALKDLIVGFLGVKGEADWSLLRGVIPSERSSVELQHEAWRID
ncbi:MAG: hypothetical protein QXO55_05950 [Candidatus Korarchaeum sp.]